jgi:hypothetical protein
MKEIDTEWNDFPVCPHCGEEDQDWGDRYRKWNGYGWEVECGFCQKDYIVTISVSYHFDTTQLEGERQTTV